MVKVHNYLFILLELIMLETLLNFVKIVEDL